MRSGAAAGLDRWWRSSSWRPLRAANKGRRPGNDLYDIFFDETPGFGNGGSPLGCFDPRIFALLLIPTPGYSVDHGHVADTWVSAKRLPRAHGLGVRDQDYC